MYGSKSKGRKGRTKKRRGHVRHSAKMRSPMR